MALPDTKDIERQTRSLQEKVDSLIIKDDESYMSASELLLQIKAKQKLIEPILDEPVAIQRRALEGVRAWRDKYLVPIEEMRRRVADMIGRWDLKQREKRRLEAEKAAKEAQERAEAERRKQIAEAKKAGDKETVQNLKASPIVPIVVAPKTPEPPKVAGVTTTYFWDYEIVDENKLDRQYMTPNEKMIRGLVSSLGAKAANVLGPGVRIFERPRTSGRA